MHENTSDDSCLILPGTKCRKLHSSSRDAFKAVNTTPIARVNIEKKKIDIIGKYKKTSKEKLKVKTFNDKIKVGLLKVHTNMLAEQVKFYKGYSGLIFEGVGLAGNIPINEHDSTTTENGRIAKAIKDLITSGTIVASTTQTIFGRVNMDVYSTGRKMQDLGIIGNQLDMTPETAFIKLAWLLSNYKKDEAKKLFSENLRGEISERTEKGTFLK